MKLSEAEAKFKWCPHVRIVTGKIAADRLSSERIREQPAFNRIVDAGRWMVPAGGSCIGTQCMSWEGDASAGDCGLKRHVD